MRTIEIDDRTYALGLLWFLPSDSNLSKRAMLKRAQAAATHENYESEQFNFVSLRTDQYGLGRYDDRLPPKTVSLASAFKPQIKTEAFLGVFCFGENLWWVCCQLRNKILAIGDIVCDSKEDAFKAASDLRHYIEKPGYEEIAKESKEDSLEYLWPYLMPDTPLRPLFESSEQERLIIKGALGAALLVVFCFGVSWISGIYKTRQEARLTAQMLAQKKASRKEYLAHPELHFKKYWLEAPEIIPAGLQCSKAFMSLPVSVNTWMLEESVCSPGGSINITWSHRKGASFVSLPSGSHLTTPQQASEIRTLPKLSNRPSPSPTDPLPLLTKDQVTALLYELSQNVGCYLSLSWDPPEELQVDDETTITAPWQRGVFDLSQLSTVILLGPDLFGALSYPGSVLASLTMKNDELSVRGYIYATSAF